MKDGSGTIFVGKRLSALWGFWTCKNWPVSLLIVSLLDPIWLSLWTTSPEFGGDTPAVQGQQNTVVQNSSFLKIYLNTIIRGFLSHSCFDISVKKFVKSLTKHFYSFGEARWLVIYFLSVEIKILYWNEREKIWMKSFVFWPLVDTGF